MTVEPKPRLRWDGRRRLWRRWNHLRGEWMSDYLRTCVFCRGQFIGSSARKVCMDCGQPLANARKGITYPAHLEVARAKRKGLLPHLDGSVKCVDCGAAAAVYDHRDYSRPLAVDPVCRRCNVRRGSAPGLEHLSRRVATTTQGRARL